MIFGDLRKLISGTAFVWIENPDTHFIEAGEAAFLSNDFDACQVTQIYPSYCPIGISIRVGSRSMHKEGNQ
ncbi:MAG: hypothetical protein VB023_04415 [Oscillibacter sp.]|nr:hypothetical protein [Oscillibacter sp.]